MFYTRHLVCILELSLGHCMNDLFGGLNIREIQNNYWVRTATCIIVRVEDKAQRNQSPPAGGMPPLMAWPPLPTTEASGFSVRVTAFLLLEPFFWRSFNQASCKHRGRRSHLRAFIIETVFRLCSWRSGLSNDDNTNKRETQCALERICQPEFSPSFGHITADI